MTRTTYKRVPFDLKLAKKIINEEVKGRIVTEDGLPARIVCFDLKYGGSKILAVLIDCGDYEIGVRCDLDGTCRDTRKEDNFNLHLEVPTYYRDYSDFKPRKYQSCLVRNGEKRLWGIQVYAYTDYQGKMLFYDGEGHLRQFANCLPLSKATKHLLGTTKSYEAVIKYLDAESTSTNQDAEFEDDKEFDFHEIKTFADACEKLGMKEHLLTGSWCGDVEAQGQAQALYKLLIIQKAINNCKWRDEDGWSYYPYWVLYSKEEMERMSEEKKQKKGIKQLLSRTNAVDTDDSGVRCATTVYRGAYASAAYGFPLCFNSEEAAIYAAHQFEDLFFQYYGIKVKA